MELTTAQVATETGHSPKQVSRYAEAGQIPDCRRIAGKGPGTGFVFKKSAKLDEWIRQHTLCIMARGVGPGRKSRASYSSITGMVEATSKKIQYQQKLDAVTSALSALSKQLPKKVRKLISLRGVRFEQLAELRKALEPIWLLQVDLSVKHVQLRKNKRL